MTAATSTSQHGIKDNHSRGKVADFLGAKLATDSKLSVVSAYFTICAYEALSQELDGIGALRFQFGEPRFIASLDPDKSDKKAFKIEDEGLELANRLQQKEVARRCAEWIERKVEIRSICESNLLHGKLYHIDDGRREHALMGSSNFTRRGLGLSTTPNIELNMVVDSDRDRADLKQWFDELWTDDSLVEDVKVKVLEYLAQLYVDHPPEFIYFNTLFHIFEKFLAGQDEIANFFENTTITEGLFRIIQSIRSPKAELFKRWLAQVGYERVKEIENPELASARARELYQAKGYPQAWIGMAAALHHGAR